LDPERSRAFLVACFDLEEGKKKAAQSDRDLGQLIRKLANKVKADFPRVIKEDEAKSNS
jgi:formiminotetrahydrofolate cyclodeaminase